MNNFTKFLPIFFTVLILFTSALKSIAQCLEDNVIADDETFGKTVRIKNMCGKTLFIKLTCASGCASWSPCIDNKSITKIIFNKSTMDWGCKHMSAYEIFIENDK
jgi:hypothetical protein